MTRLKTIQRLAKLQPAVFDRKKLAPSRCILATAVGVEVLGRFGVQARPLSVKLDLVNAAWVRWVQAGKPGGQAAALKMGAWALAAGYPPEAWGVQPNAVAKPERGGWDGHLVVEVPGNQCLIDLDMQQLNRPDKGIIMPDAAVLHLVEPDVGTYTTPDGGMLRVEAKREDLTFQAARDWWDRGNRADLVDEVERAVRKGRL